MNNTAAAEYKNTFDDPLYQMSYNASIAMFKNVIPFLNEKDETAVRLGLAAREVPRLIATGLGGNGAAQINMQPLSRAALHCREAIVMLSFCRDLHSRFINGMLCSELIEMYRKVDGELSRLSGKIRYEGEEIK